MTTYNVDPFYALADVNRREILLMLKKEKLNISTLADSFSISRPAVSKHIKVLSDSGFVTITDIGRERYCELNQQGFNEITDWINFFDAFWTKKFTKLEALLAKNKNKKQNK